MLNKDPEVYFVDGQLCMASWVSQLALKCCPFDTTNEAEVMVWMLWFVATYNEELACRAGGCAKKLRENALKYLTLLQADGPDELVSLVHRLPPVTFGMPSWN